MINIVKNITIDAIGNESLTPSVEYHTNDKPPYWRDNRPIISSESLLRARTTPNSRQLTVQSPALFHGARMSDAKVRSPRTDAPKADEELEVSRTVVTGENVLGSRAREERGDEAHKPSASVSMTMKDIMRTGIQDNRPASPNIGRPTRMLCSMYNATGKTQFARIPKSLVIDVEDDGEDSEEFLLRGAFDSEFISPLHTETQVGLSYLDVQIHGLEELQQQQRKLIKEYKELFKSALNAQPALLEPMSLEVDLTRWHSMRNRTSARIQTREKETAMDTMVETMLEAGIIRPSQAAAYSQVLLVPKPNKVDWRFCVDFRSLNNITKSNCWPLPLIKSILKNIGDKRPRFFAIMDLTSGYHQLALAQDSTELTAFITNRGLFEFTRVPFGLIDLIWLGHE